MNTNTNTNTGGARNLRAQSPPTIVPEVWHAPQHPHTSSSVQDEHRSAYQQRRPQSPPPIAPKTRGYDRDYLISVSGIAKISCLICNLLGILCILLSSIAASNLRGSLYNIVAFGGLLTTGFALLARLFHLWERYFMGCNYVRWEMWLHGTLAGLHFFTSAFALSLDVFSYTMAAFFGLLAFSLHSLESYKSYRRSRQRDVATQTESV